MEAFAGKYEVDCFGWYGSLTQKGDLDEWNGCQLSSILCDERGDQPTDDLTSLL